MVGPDFSKSWCNVASYRSLWSASVRHCSQFHLMHESEWDRVFMDWQLGMKMSQFATILLWNHLYICIWCNLFDSMIRSTLYILLWSTHFFCEDPGSQAGLLIYRGMIIRIEQDMFPRHLLPMRQNLCLETRYQLMLPVLWLTLTRPPSYQTGTFHILLTFHCWLAPNDNNLSN